MAKKGVRRYTVYLDPDIADALLEISAQRYMELDDTLNQIVREWGENKDIEPLNSRLESPTLSEIEDRLNIINYRLKGLFDSIETVVAVQAEDGS